MTQQQEPPAVYVPLTLSKAEIDGSTPTWLEVIEPTADGERWQPVDLESRPELAEQFRAALFIDSVAGHASECPGEGASEHGITLPVHLARQLGRASCEDEITVKYEPLLPLKNTQVV